MKKIAIIGAGGHTRSLINVLELNNFKIEGVYDDAFDSSKKELINGYLLRGCVDNVPRNAQLILSIGDNTKRKELFAFFGKQIYKKSLIHPSSILEKKVLLGSSNQILAKVYINSHAKLGDNNIINTSAIIEHEVSIGSHNHLAVGVILCGRVQIGNCCFIGAGAVLVDKISICDNVTVGANSTVIRDIIKPGIYVGSPARRID